MNIKPIKTQEDHQGTLREIETLMTALPDTPEGERLDILVTLVEAYEQKHFPMEEPDPIAAIEFTMDQQGLTPKDLQPMIGRLNRVYEILRRTRPLTLPMIRKLHKMLGIPAESLIKDPDESRVA